MRNVKTLLAIFALAIPVLLMACSKEGTPLNDITAVKLSFTDTKVSPKLPGEGSKIDLSKATTVKIEYTVEDGSNHTMQVQQAELAIAGDRSKVSTIDQRVLTFKGGSKLTILSATLFDVDGNVIATAPTPDTFKVRSPQGVLIMERCYEAIGLER